MKQLSVAQVLVAMIKAKGIAELRYSLHKNRGQKVLSKEHRPYLRNKKMDPKKKLVCKKCAKKFVVSSETKEFLPFCSKRCKMVDLGKWLGEKYVVEGASAPVDKMPDDEE